jgi:indolepyruvate ferredoxin oxidoreductase
VLKVLAKGKGLRGTALDPFGRTAERRLERSLIDSYEARIRDLLGALTPERRGRRGGDRQRAARHPRLRPRQARQPRDRRARESELLHRFDPARYPRPSGVPRPGSSAAFRSARREPGRRCYTFAHAHSAHVRMQVAGPGSLALAGPVVTRLNRRDPF